MDSFLRRNEKEEVGAGARDSRFKWFTKDLWKSKGACVLSAATLGILVQFASMYMFSYGLKVQSL